MLSLLRGAVEVRGALITVDRQRARARAVAPEAQPHHRFAHGLSPERAVCNAAPVRMRHAALARIHSGREVLDRSHGDAVLAHIHNRDRALALVHIHSRRGALAVVHIHRNVAPALVHIHNEPVALVHIHTRNRALVLVRIHSRCGA